jgi:predicted negative regulator of RcsB-dependent stress response
MIINVIVLSELIQIMKYITKNAGAILWVFIVVMAGFIGYKFNEQFNNHAESTEIVTVPQAQTPVDSSSNKGPKIYRAEFNIQPQLGSTTND